LQTSERTWELSPEEAAAYHRLCNWDCASVDLVDDRTWADLELIKIFRSFDGAVTPLGAQYLYALLRRYQCNPASLGENVKTFQAFKNQPAAAARLRGATAQMNREEAAHLADFLLGPIPETPPRYRIFYLLSALSLPVPSGCFSASGFCCLF
jgi:hypothetical protein